MSLTASLPENLTPEQAIDFLQLGVGGTNPREQLRNLCRRHGLPVVRAGKLQRFRRSALVAWLEQCERGR